MSQPFSYFNALPTATVLGQLSQALFPLGGAVQFTDDVHPKLPGVRVPDDFLQRLQNIRNWWNLDRSEAARRTYIDAFIYLAMDYAQSTSLIVTPEEYIAPNLLRLGAGYLDYLLAAINRQTTAPIYNPSVIIEAKASLAGATPDGQNQLLVEMVTLWQIEQTQQGLTHGVLTDGRFWKYYEMHMSAGTILATPLYDSNDLQQMPAVLGLLAKFFKLYNSSSSSFV